MRMRDQLTTGMVFIWRICYKDTMLKNTHFRIKFYLAHGHLIEVITEDEGLTRDQLQLDVRAAIDDDDFYITHDVIRDIWKIIKAKTIHAFTIEDIGKDLRVFEEINEEDSFSFRKE